MNALNTRIVLRNDSLANWLASQSVILYKGEVGIEFSENGNVKIKIGDGVTPWSGLKYFSGEFIGDDKSIEVVNDALQLAGYDKAEIGTYPVKGPDGSITWVIPNDEEVQQLKSDVVDLRTIIGEQATAETPATGLFSLISEKADAADVYAKLDEINNKLSTVYNYRGSKPTYADLPTEGQAVGDVWNVETADPAHGIKAGDNVAWNGTAWDRLAGTVDLSGYTTNEEFAPVKKAVEDLPLIYATKEEFNPVKKAVEDLPLIYLTQQKAAAVYEAVKYRVTNTPTGTLVDYREKEIRIMCPPDTKWVHQNPGANGDPNNYYIALRIYAPNDMVVSFKEDMGSSITDDTMHYFENNSFAGIDEYGRKYSIIWLAVARYDSANQTWKYYGETSNAQKCLGWDYIVEWYDINGVKVATDSTRINLTNASCHYIAEPYHMRNVVKGVKFNGTLLDTVDGVVNITLPAIVTSADENKVSINDDGTMEVNSVNVNKLVQNNNEYILLNGGTSSV